jgi:hypothetical protein
MELRNVCTAVELQNHREQCHVANCSRVAVLTSNHTHNPSESDFCSALLFDFAQNRVVLLSTEPESTA